MYWVHLLNFIINFIIVYIYFVSFDKGKKKYFKEFWKGLSEKHLA